MNPLVMPQVNLNGTARADLVRQQCDVFAALRDLQGAMAQAMPHGRDYQFRPDEYPAARDAWLERMLVVEQMREEVEAHAVAIQESK